MARKGMSLEDVSKATGIDQEILYLATKDKIVLDLLEIMKIVDVLGHFNVNPNLDETIKVTKKMQQKIFETAKKKKIATIDLAKKVYGKDNFMQIYKLYGTNYVYLSIHILKKFCKILDLDYEKLTKN